MFNQYDYQNYGTTAAAPKYERLNRGAIACASYYGP